MRIHILCEESDHIKEELKQGHVTFDDQAEYLLIKRENNYLVLRNEMIALTDLIYVESLGHELILHTKNGDHSLRMPLYEISRLLNTDFLRISKSVIIRKDQIIHAKAYLSSKFQLTMSNGDHVDVTRTYYYQFKETFGL